jgi:hypothetical protein
MADNSYMPGLYNIVTTVEVAVPRAQALEAAHVLRLPPDADAWTAHRPRHRSRAAVVAAVIILVSLAFSLAVSVLQRV